MWSTKSGSAPRFYLVLHNIRSLYNVGAAFRTADAAGIAKIFLTGYTGAPEDRFGRPQEGIRKTALGAEKSVPWESCASLSRLIDKLRKEKIFILALEQSPQSFSYEKAAAYLSGKKLAQKSGLALLAGNEVRGLSLQIIKKCDAVMEIPMRGQKESLNVSVATGIALFKLREVVFSKTVRKPRCLRYRSA